MLWLMSEFLSEFHQNIIQSLFKLQSIQNDQVDLSNLHLSGVLFYKHLF